MKTLKVVPERLLLESEKRHTDLTAELRYLAGRDIDYLGQYRTGFRDAQEALTQILDKYEQDSK